MIIIFCIHVSYLLNFNIVASFDTKYFIPDYLSFTFINFSPKSKHSKALIKAGCNYFNQKKKKSKMTNFKDVSSSIYFLAKFYTKVVGYEILKSTFPFIKASYILF